MKKLFSTFVLITLFISISFAQEEKKDQVIDLNFLKAPASTAANILGFSPNEIQSPTDPSALVASFQNATSNFTSLPKSFALDIAPYRFFGKKKMTFNDYISNKLGDNLKQSLVISVAYRDSSNALKGYQGNSFIAFGAKVSLIRGKNEILHTFYDLDKFIEANVDKNPQYLALTKQAEALEAANGRKLTAESEKIRNKVIALEDSLKKKFSKEFNGRNEAEKNLKYETIRTGFKLDLAGGFSYRYPQNNVDSTQFFRGGVWATFGYDWLDAKAVNQWSVLGILRYLRNPEQPWADTEGKLKGKTGIETFDCGIKTSFNNTGNHTTSFNLEALYRSIVSKQDEASKIDPSFRLALSANYEINKNMVLSLAIGRDFDGAVSKSGNVFAFLNLITAFGSHTTITDK